MEHLSPSLSLLMSVRRSIELGNSVRRGVECWIQTDQSEFREQVLTWKGHIESGRSNEWGLKAEQLRLNPWRKTLLELLEQGIEGAAIGKALEALELEMMRSVDDEIQEKLGKLPYLAMIPTLLFQLPAILLLLFGPLVRNFLHSLGG